MATILKGETMTAVPFGRNLELGDIGPDVRAMKRALARAGFGPKKLAGISPIFGPFAVRNLKAFQATNGSLDQDGIYGPHTHWVLSPSFDQFAWVLYAKRLANTVQLPASFVATHQTGGLSGYPAVDVFADAGTIALSPADGTVTRTSGRKPGATAKPGGPYGYSVYVGPYFLTHFGSLHVGTGDVVKVGQTLGTIADYTKATKGITPSHIHIGKRT